MLSNSPPVRDLERDFDRVDLRRHIRLCAAIRMRLVVRFTAFEPTRGGSRPNRQPSSPGPIPGTSLVNSAGMFTSVSGRDCVSKTAGRPVAGCTPTWIGWPGSRPAFGRESPSSRDGGQMAATGCQAPSGMAVSQPDGPCVAPEGELNDCAELVCCFPSVEYDIGRRQGNVGWRCFGL
jgi:hypothetical protein